MAVPVFALYCALAALVLLALSLRVILTRRRKQIGLGDGGDKELQRHMRVHANACENLPIQLLLLLAMELTGSGPGALHAAGAAIVLGRLLHAAGMLRSGGASFGRLLGTLLSLGVTLGMALVLLLRAFAA